MKNKLELYGTLGPADYEKEILHAMFQAGMTGLRLNLSHTNLSDCKEWLSNLYTVSEELHIVPDLLIDLQGPELRIGILEHSLLLEAGDLICFVQEDRYAECTLINKIPVSAAVLEHLLPEQQVRLDDGKICSNIIVTPEEYKNTYPDGSVAFARVTIGGMLSSRKSIILDECEISLPTLTLKDIENLKVAKDYRVTGVMLPFVRGKEDLLTLKKTLLELDLPHVRIFAKIENQAGVDQLSSLIPHCDQIVIARGDLGNAYPLSHLPVVQKEISEECLMAKKPFMVVTQMLDSMMHSPVPTRAEVSDIFRAIMDGATSVMLTGETAAGKYPVEAMQMLCDTAWEALRYRQTHRMPFI